MQRIPTTINGETVAKRMMWLAWQAVGGPFGMGVLRDNPGAGEDQVWANVVTSGDYACSQNKPGDVHADYVFGRMMKLSVKWGDDFVEVPTYAPTRDYQAWCHKYPTYEALAQAAVASLTPETAAV